jgi:hypothetical protein
MSSSDPNSSFENALSQINYIIDAVEERGYDDVQEEYDDYGILIERFEFRNLIVFELYEAYFRPRRHEFELQILKNLIDAVVSSKPAAFVVGATAAGVVGNAAYDILKRVLGHIVKRFSRINRSRDAFREIERTLDGVRAFFKTHDHARIDEICVSLGLEPHKVEPILKLLGFQCRRRRKQQTWKRPDSWQ